MPFPLATTSVELNLKSIKLHLWFRLTALFVHPTLLIDNHFLLFSSLACWKPGSLSSTLFQKYSKSLTITGFPKHNKVPVSISHFMQQSLKFLNHCFCLCRFYPAENWNVFKGGQDMHPCNDTWGTVEVPRTQPSHNTLVPKGCETTRILLLNAMILKWRQRPLRSCFPTTQWYLMEDGGYLGSALQQYNMIFKGTL